MEIEELLALDDSHSEEVPVPEWGGEKMTVVSMTAEERCEVEKRWFGKNASSDPRAFRLDILQRTWKKADKKTPYGTPEQFAALMGKNANAVETVFEAACRVSAFSRKDVQELGKN